MKNQGTASEATLVALLSAKAKAVKQSNESNEAIKAGKLIAYASGI